MFRRGLSARLERHLERGEEELRLSREVHERHRVAFEGMMASFDRFQERFDRMDERFNRFDERFNRFDERFERYEKRSELHEKRLDRKLDEHTVFLHEISRRSEKAMQNLIKRNGEFFDALSAKLDANTEVLLAEVRENREESRAQREALLALIDRLPPAQAA